MIELLVGIAQVVAGLAIIGGLTWLRYWLYYGRGRWIGVSPPDNVINLDDYR